MRKERSALEPESKAFADYRRLLQYYAVLGARDCIQSALAADTVNPFEFDSQLNGEGRHAASQAVDVVLARLGTDTKVVRPVLLQIQREILEGSVLFPLHQELARLLTTPVSLNPAESTAFEQAASAIGQHFRGSHICFYDGYFDTESKFGPRRRDLAVVWDGFEGVAWSERIAAIKRVFVYPRFSVIGITPNEVEGNEVHGISSHVRAARKVDATQVSDIVKRL